MKAFSSKTVIPGAIKLCPCITTPDPLMNNGLKMYTLVFIIFLSSTKLIVAQSAETHLSDFFGTKYTRNNTVGGLLLIPGARMVAMHGFQENNPTKTIADELKPNKSSKIGFLGTAMTLTSIPFFIPAGSKRNRASLSLTRGTIAITKRGPGNFSYLGVSLTIKI